MIAVLPFFEKSMRGAEVVVDKWRNNGRGQVAHGHGPHAPRSVHDQPGMPCRGWIVVIFHRVNTP